MYLQKSMNTSEKQWKQCKKKSMKTLEQWMKTSKKWMNTIQNLKKNIEKSIDNLPIVFSAFRVFTFQEKPRTEKLKNWKTEFHKRRMDPRLLLWNSVFQFFSFSVFQFFSFPTVGASNLIGTKSVPKYIKFTVNTSKIEVCIGFWGGYHIYIYIRLSHGLCLSSHCWLYPMILPNKNPMNNHHAKLLWNPSTSPFFSHSKKPWNHRVFSGRSIRRPFGFPTSVVAKRCERPGTSLLWQVGQQVGQSNLPFPQDRVSSPQWLTCDK